MILYLNLITTCKKVNQGSLRLGFRSKLKQLFSYRYVLSKKCSHNDKKNPKHSFMKQTFVWNNYFLTDAFMLTKKYEIFIHEVKVLLNEGEKSQKSHFLTFPACFQIPIMFSNFNFNCSNLSYLRNLQKQV